MIKKFLSPIYEFLQDSRAVGIILIICTAFSLILANSTWQTAYLACGIGFTMSIFIATLAYTSADWQVTSKIAVIAASLASGLLGYCYLRIVK
ncbi:Na+/H+ antiporter NhaA [Chitinophaga agri]|nr:Na+/H+ antiporter NhaA [Chitinophaga agri]